MHMKKHLFEGVCLTTVILAPGASEVGLGAAALAPLWGDRALAALRGAEFREVTFCAQVAYLRTICSELDVQFRQKA